jgi:hypothetical protein
MRISSIEKRARCIADSQISTRGSKCNDTCPADVCCGDRFFRARHGARWRAPGQGNSSHVANSQTKVLSHATDTAMTPARSADRRLADPRIRLNSRKWDIAVAMMLWLQLALGLLTTPRSMKVG